MCHFDATQLSSPKQSLMKSCVTLGKTLLLCTALGLLAARLHAQSYTIDWFTIDGGGGTSTGGVYAVSGTIGQPDAGQLSGGNFTLSGGFWGGLFAIQQPGAPTLHILNSGPNYTIS